MKMIKKVIIGFALFLLFGVIFITAGDGENPPVLKKNLSDIIINESQTIEHAFDLDDYFDDIDGDELGYNYSGNIHTTITIDQFNRVTVTAQAGWHGEDHVIFNATDGAYDTMSNNITIIINPKKEYSLDLGSFDYYPWTDIYTKEKGCYVLNKFGNMEKCSINIRVW